MVTGEEIPEICARGFSVGRNYISSVTLPSGRRGQKLDVNITGFGTSFNATCTPVFSGDGITVNDSTIIDPERAKANITIVQNATPGARDVNLVKNRYEPLPLKDSFTVAQASPTVTSISPDSGIRGTTVNITNLAGSGFYGTPIVKLKKTGKPDITATNVALASLTRITRKLPIPGGLATGP